MYHTQTTHTQNRTRGQGLTFYLLFILAACSSHVEPASDTTVPVHNTTIATLSPSSAAVPSVEASDSRATVSSSGHSIVSPDTDPSSEALSNEQPVYDTRTLTSIWTFDTGGDVRDSPIVDEQTVYIAAAETGIFALDTTTGEQLWNYRPSEGIWERSLGMIHQDAQTMLVVGLRDEMIAALDARTGQEIWRVALIGNVQRPALIDGDTVYVGTTFVGPNLDNDPRKHAWLYALSLSTGSIIWSFETENYLTVTPTLAQGTLYAGGSYYDPTLDVDEGGPMRIYARDAASGQEKWTVEGDAGLIKRIYATENFVYFLAYRDELVALDAATGETIWSYHTENWTPDFLLTGDGIYFGVGNGFMHAVDAQRGEQRWKTRLDIFRRPLEAPQLVDGMLYLAVAQQQIFALDAVTGTVAWVAEHSIPSREGLVVAEGQFYLVDTDGIVHVLAVQ